MIHKCGLAKGLVSIGDAVLKGYSQSRQFIATQAPLPQTIPDFWRMIWEHHCMTIVCLAQETENGKVRCLMNNVIEFKSKDVVVKIQVQRYPNFDVNAFR